MLISLGRALICYRVLGSLGARVCIRGYGRDIMLNESSILVLLLLVLEVNADFICEVLIFVKFGRYH